MNLIIEKHIGDEAYKKVLETFGGNSEYEAVFNSFLVDFLQDLEKDNDIDHDDTAEDLLEVPTDFIDRYIKCREVGFSKTWSATQADLEISDDTYYAVFECYKKVEAIKQGEALKDLQVFCKTKNGDPLYNDFLIDHVTRNEYTERPIEELAADYSKIYKEQKEKGKSETFSHKYAELMAGDEFHQIYCEDYAFIYDQSIALGKSEEYADRYAEKYASELVDVKRRAGIHDDEESLEFARDKARAYINGWEYATQNNIKKMNVFIDCYSNAYLNTIYSDEWSSIKELEKISLKKALEKFEKK
jgi:hypothetical protein